MSDPVPKQLLFDPTDWNKLFQFIRSNFDDHRYQDLAVTIRHTFFQPVSARNYFMTEVAGTTPARILAEGGVDSILKTLKEQSPTLCGSSRKELSHD